MELTMKEKLEGAVKQLQSFAKASNSHYKDMIERIKSDLAYVGGEMFTDTEKRNYGIDRPDMPIMMLNTYCDQIKNQYAQQPFGMELSAKTIKAKASVDKVKGILRGIESTSNAKATYTVAIDRQTKAGRGYAAVTTEYASSGGFDQEIKIEPIHNPDLVIWDRFSKKIDGSDCQECALVEHISCQRAEDMFGEEYDWDDMTNPLEDTQWSAPEESVALVTYYKLKQTKTKIYQGTDGATLGESEVRKNNKLKSRTTTKVTCMVYKIIGDIVVGETELPIKYIPIVPFLGQMIDRKKKLDWVGLVFFGRAPCQMLNYAARESAARLAKAPKTLLTVDGMSIEGYGEWDSYGAKDLAYARYNSRDKSDPSVTYEKPSMVSASVDISDMSSTMTMYQQILPAVLGMSQAGVSQAGASNETAAAVLTRQKTMDVSNFTTLDNASESIKQVCRIILELIPVIYDTSRLVPVVDPTTGEIVSEELNIADLNIIADEYEVDISAGPMASTLKSEKLAKIIAIMQVLPPEQATKYEKYLVEASSAIDQTDIDTLFGAGDQQIDPEAKNALDQADAHITDLSNQVAQSNLMIQQLQAEVQSQKAIAQSNIVVAQIKAKNAIDVKAMDNQTKLTTEQMGIIADSKQAEQDALLELKKMQMEIANKPTVLYSDTQAPMTSVGGQKNDLFNS
jgi:hypothetical protein